MLSLIALGQSKTHSWTSQGDSSSEKEMLMKILCNKENNREIGTLINNYPVCNTFEEATAVSKTFGGKTYSFSNICAGQTNHVFLKFK